MCKTLISSSLFLFVLYCCVLKGLPLWYDEIATWDMAKTLALTQSDFPLFIYLTKGVMFLFSSESEFTLRFLPAIFSSFIPIAGYFLAKKIFTEKVAILSWAILISSPLTIFLAREARVYSLLLLMSFLAPLWVIENYKKIDFKNYSSYFLGVLTLQILGNCHIFGLYFTMLILLILISLEKFSKQSLLFAIINIAILTPPFLTTLLTLSTRFDEETWVSAPVSMISNFTSMLEYYFFSDDHRLVFSKAKKIFLISLFFLTPVIFIKKLEEKQKLFVLYAWLTIPFVVTYFFSKTIISILVPKYLLISYPAALMILTFFLIKIIEKIGGSRSSTLTYIFCVIVVASQLTFYNIKKETIHGLQINQNWKGSSEKLKPFMESSDNLLLNCAGRNAVLKYYASDLGRKKIMPRYPCKKRNVDYLGKYKKVVVFNKSFSSSEKNLIKEINSVMMLDFHEVVDQDKIWVFVRK